MSAQMTFKSQFKSARIAAGLSQPAAARLIGYSVGAVRSWEQGRKVPHAQVQAGVLEKLTAAAK